MKQPKTLYARVREAVLAGAQTAAEVLAVVGRHIAASQAIAKGKQYIETERRRGQGYRQRHPLPYLADVGRKVLVRRYLRGLAAKNKIVRLRRGVYGPPTPKLYRPEPDQRAG